MVFDKERFSISNTASKKGWLLLIPRKWSSSGVMTIFNDFGPKLSGLHPHLTSMLWTLQFGEFWPGRPEKTPIQMWRASKGASRKQGLIWMKKQYVIAVLMPTRD